MCTTCGMTVMPLPRWTVLPGDPAPLRVWLRRKQADDPDTYDLPPEPAPEEDQ